MPTHMKCAKCGAEIPELSRSPFCEPCGHKELEIRKTANEASEKEMKDSMSSRKPPKKKKKKR